MKTQRPLGDLAETLAAHIIDHSDYLQFNKKLLNVFEGQLRPEIEAEMRSELSDKSFQRARHRIPSFNLLSRITNKLSKVYMRPAIRASSTDAEAVANWEKWTRFDDKMRQANIMLNLHKITAIEPFIKEGTPQIRVIPAHSFLPFSDSPFDPTEMTVFLKFLGDKVINTTFTDNNGNLVDHRGDLEVGEWQAFSDDSIMIFQVSRRADVVWSEIQDITPNPLGKIPQTLISRSDYRLIPIPDSDSLSNTILIPKMYANLAYAVNLQAHGQMVGIDLDIDGPELSKGPDVFWSFRSSDEAGKQGKIDAVKVEIDIDEVNNLVQNILSIWLETRNVRVGTAGKASEQRASGAAKIIDQADASEDIEIQKGIMANAEQDIWSLIQLMNNKFFDQIDPKLGPKVMKEKFEVQISFQVSRSIDSPIDAISYVREQMSLSLMNRRQAIKELHPEFTSDQVDQWLEEVEEDKEFLEGVMSGTSGQFGSGNQEAAQKGDSSGESKGSGASDNKDNAKKN